MTKYRTPIHLYAEQMLEIKRRTEVIQYFLAEGGHALYQPTTTESVCLQFRKILELIAFSSLVANKDKYSAAHKDFKSHWNAERLLNDLSRINPDFYPKPIEEKRSTTPGIVNDLLAITDDYMTQDDFVQIYKKCGGILHAANPYGTKTSNHYYEKSIPVWLNKLIRLLNCHKVHLVEETGFWLIHMQEDGDNDVHFYEFGLVGKNC
jgi:hypothetical protein